MIRNLLAAIGFVCVAMAGTAGVYATRWHSDETPRIAVSTYGLDLTSPQDRYLLDRRVERAVKDVCSDSFSGYGFSGFEDRDCRRKARAGARPQIERAIDRAYQRRGGQVFVEPAGEDDYDATPIAPEPRYVQPTYVEPLRPTYGERPVFTPKPALVLREKHTTITRTALKPRVKWVKTKNGTVKKVTHRKLVRKTVKKVYTRG